MVARYFWQEARGVNEDIERHRKEEAHLSLKLEEAEKSLELNPNDKFAEMRVRTYRHFLGLLVQSKAEAVSKLGRK